ncbi:MAG TPA: hypothetical protein DCX14_05655 [Flavobacteriales bacterium]|nr:hypothetical protein [Flavobacteriales bacterium]
MISVITINLNHAEGLRRTIRSLPYAKCTFEHIIIDGQSSDHSVEVVKEESPEETILICEKDGGIYDAMNKGIRLAKGNYLYFLNSGDTLVNIPVFDRINNLSEDEVIFYGDRLVGNEKRLQQFPTSLRLSHLMFNGGIAHQSQFFPKKYFDQYGLYDANERIISDWAWNLTALAIHRLPFQHCGEVVCHYEGGGLSSSESPIHDDAVADQAKFLKQQLPFLLEDYDELETLSRMKKRNDHSKIFQLSEWIFRNKNT